MQANFCVSNQLTGLHSRCVAYLGVTWDNNIILWGQVGSSGDLTWIYIPAIYLTCLTTVSLTSSMAILSLVQIKCESKEKGTRI